MIVYRVMLEVGWRDAMFEFDTSEDAVGFAESCLKHMVGTKDVEKKSKIHIEVVDKEKEESEEK